MVFEAASVRNGVAVIALDFRRPHVFSGRALVTLNYIELDTLAFFERFEAGSLDGGVVHKTVFLTILASDESEALLIVEPFHGSCHTHAVLPRSGFVDGVGVRRGRTNRSFIAFREYRPPRWAAGHQDAGFRSLKATTETWY